MGGDGIGVTEHIGFVTANLLIFEASTAFMDGSINGSGN
jgi:hypothetical protein